LQQGALDVILAEDVFLGGWWGMLGVEEVDNGGRVVGKWGRKTY